MSGIKGKDSLLFRLGIIFLIFIIAVPLITGTASYIGRSRQAMREDVNKLREVGEHLAALEGTGTAAYETAKSSFGLADAYFIELSPEGSFLLDGRPYTDETDVFLKRVIEAGRSGKALDEYPVRDGKLFCYCPVIVNGSGIGVIGVSIVIPDRGGELLRGAVLQSLVLLAALALCAFAMLWFVKNSVIGRISVIEDNLRKFGDSRDAAVTEGLKALSGGKDELCSLSRTAAEMVNSIDGCIAGISAETAERVRIGADLNVATKIQADMLPTKFPERTEFDVFATMSPAKEVGGDFYDVFRIDSNHYGLVMADVSGKGVPAALFMVVARTLIQDRALMGRSPARVLEHANNKLCENNASGLFVTVWLGVLELTSGNLICCNAGHEYPALKRAGGEYVLLEADNFPPLATMEDMEYEDEMITLAPGDSIFLYTDGVPEAKNAAGKRFGTDRMIAELNRNKELSPKELLTVMKKQVDDFTGEMDPFDDVTMLCVDYFGKPAKKSGEKGKTFS